MNLSYENYLNSEHWLNFRDVAIALAGYECEECGYEENLNVHHLTYVNLWHEDITDVKVLCYRCHMELHQDMDRSAYRAQIKIEKAENKEIDIFERLGILETDECILICNQCGAKEIMEAHMHTHKLGCKCGDPHQRWEIPE